MIGELESSPRQAVAELARKIGISVSSAGRKLQTLLGKRIVRVISIVDPSALGYSIRAAILVKVHPGKTHAAAIEITRYRNINQVAIISGDFDLMVSGAFRDLEDMHYFLGSELGQIPGVMRHETMIHIKIVKRCFSFFPDGSDV